MAVVRPHLSSAAAGRPRYVSASQATTEWRSPRLTGVTSWRMSERKATRRPVSARTGVADGPEPGVVEQPVEGQRPAVERLREGRLAGAVQEDDDGNAPASREVVLGLDWPVPVRPEVVAGTVDEELGAFPRQSSFREMLLERRPHSLQMTGHERRLLGGHHDPDGPASLLVERRDAGLENRGRAPLGAFRRGANARTQSVIQEVLDDVEPEPREELGG